MMSNEHGEPDGATGAQGAENVADGMSGSSRGYSALTGRAAADSVGGRADQADAMSRVEAWSDDVPGSAEAPTLSWVRPDRDAAGAAGAATVSWTRGDETVPGSGDVPGQGRPLAGTPAPPDEDDAGQHDVTPKRRTSTWRELPILVIVALTIALVIKTFVVQPFFIPSSSMEDTLLMGDKVLVNKLIYHFRSIQPGDIIVFNGDGSWNANPPASPSASNPLARAYDATLRPLFDSIAGLFGTPLGQTDYIKRVIGTPGDRVACCNGQGLVTVNGIPLHEQSYLYPGAAPSTLHFDVVVPPGRLWVMGDNRAISYDSRLRMSDPGDGTIPENKVIGRAFLVVWPPSQWRILPIPSTFDQPGIDKTGSSASSASANATAQLLGARVQPGAPYMPLAAGFAVALPITWLQRRARRGLAERLRRRRQHRHS